MKTLILLFTMMYTIFASCEVDELDPEKPNSHPYIELTCHFANEPEGLVTWMYRLKDIDGDIVTGYFFDGLDPHNLWDPENMFIVKYPLWEEPKVITVQTYDNRNASHTQTFKLDMKNKKFEEIKN